LALLEKGLFPGEITLVTESDAQKMPTVMMIMLCTRCALGGAEKRYARTFEMLVAHYPGPHKLVISREMLDLLQAAGILRNIEPNLIVLAAPFSGATLKALWYMWQCWRLVGRHRPQLVHPLLTARYLSLPALVLHPGVAHLMSSYSTRLKPERGRNKLLTDLSLPVQLFAFRRSRLIDALSWDIRDQLIEAGIDPDKINVAPCSFSDYSRCRPASHKEKSVVFLARFVAEKGPLLLAEAMAAVVANHPDVHFYFLGRGYLQPEIEAQVAAQQLADHVSIRFDPQPTDVLNRSAIFVSLQHFNNYPSQSLLEAMACGNAVVATDVGETHRLVDETVGLRIEPEAPALAEALNRLLDSPDLPRLQQTARARATTEHTPERFFEYINDVYRRVVTP
jgi:glycosyltransferase involved in cell wall biosynthesis